MKLAMFYLKSGNVINIGCKEGKVYTDGHKITGYEIEGAPAMGIDLDELEAVLILEEEQIKRLGLDK